MAARTLAQWLSYQEGLHPNAIDMGLERLQQVLYRLEWRRPKCQIITVGGTNGKGSSVALIDSILSAANYRVGTFTSPHLVHYNERIRISGTPVSDETLVAAFERIELARGAISLTFFEFNTLAALLIFSTACVDAILLEVGLGGTLDAVNVVDADVSLVCSVALDHCEWLGNDVESIGRWKAGIFRPRSRAIFGSRNMPLSIASEAERIGAPLWQLGVNFDYAVSGDTWRWDCSEKGALKDLGTELPFPALIGTVQLDNAAAALAVLHSLPTFTITTNAIASGLRDVRLAGRFQILELDGIEWIFDVAHNPAAAKTLSDNLSIRPVTGRTLGVFGVFADKDVGAIIDIMSSCVTTWLVTAVSGARALSTQLLASKIIATGGVIANESDNVKSACEFAKIDAQRGDRVVVFGSFHTVGPALKWISDISELPALDYGHKLRGFS